jgi:HPt (histidine-containing phosphotransfer) domain-containing protein
MSHDAAPAQPPHLDVARGLEMLGNPETLRTILRTVNEQLSGNILDIQRVLRDGDVAAANSLLHGLKGYAPVFCTDPLVQQIIEIERVSKTAAAPVVQALYDGLQPRLEALLQEIRAYIAQG